MDEQRINSALHDALYFDRRPVCESEGIRASGDYIFQHTFAVADGLNQDIISTMVDNLIEIEDTRVVMDLETDEEILRILRKEPENDEDSVEVEVEAGENAGVQAKRIGHKRAKDMAQSLSTVIYATEKQ